MLTTNRVMGGVGKAGLLMAAGMGAGIIYATKQAGDFQEQMNVLQAVTGANKDSMKAFRDEAIALGADLKLPNTSAQDAAVTLTELSKGGLSVKQALDAARGTIQLATAAQIDNATAAKIQSRALKAFNLDGTQAGHVADLLANGANASTAEIEDLALGFQQASAVFHSTGHNADELTTAITEMADAGITGSDAGTSLRTMMNRLNPQTKKAREEFKKLGIDVFDSTGHYKSMRDIIKEFSSGLSNLNPKQKQHALYTIFGSDAIRAANIVLDGGTKKYDKYNQKVTKSGTAQRVATAHTKGFNGAVQGFISSMQTAAINIGTLFLPMMTSLMHTLSSGAQFLSEHATATKILASAIFALGTTLATATAIYKVYNTYTRLAEFYTTLYKESTLLLRIQLALLSAQQKIAAAAQWLLNAAMSANPIGLVVIAVAALIAGFILLYKHSGTFRELVNGLWDDLKGLGEFIWDLFGKTIPRAVRQTINWVKNNWKEIAIWILFPFPKLIQKAAEFFGIKEKLRGALNAIIGFVRTWGGKLIDFFGTLPQRMWNVGRKMGERLKDGITGVITGLGATLRRLLGAAINAAIGAWNGLSIPGFNISIHKGPFDFDLNTGSIPLPDIPRVSLAQGGITTGPTLAIVGDNPSGREAIIPLPDRGGVGGGGDTYNITLEVQGSLLAERDLEKRLLEVLTTYGRRNGRVRLATSTSA